MTAFAKSSGYLQAKPFLEEWQRLRQKSDRLGDTCHVGKDPTTRRKAAGERHLYMKFYGD